MYAGTLPSLGDLLQHFLTVIFNKLDKGETWDDDFELNTILQVQLLLFNLAFSSYFELNTMTVGYLDFLPIYNMAMSILINCRNL